MKPVPVILASDPSALTPFIYAVLVGLIIVGVVVGSVFGQRVTQQLLKLNGSSPPYRSRTPAIVGGIVGGVVAWKLAIPMFTGSY